MSKGQGVCSFLFLCHWTRLLVDCLLAVAFSSLKISLHQLPSRHWFIFTAGFSEAFLSQNKISEYRKCSFFFLQVALLKPRVGKMLCYNQNTKHNIDLKNDYWRCAIKIWPYGTNKCNFISFSWHLAVIGWLTKKTHMTWTWTRGSFVTVGVLFGAALQALRQWTTNCWATLCFSSFTSKARQLYMFSVHRQFLMKRLTQDSFFKLFLLFSQTQQNTGALLFPCQITILFF